jgi:predicted small metal-binding protein
MKEVSCEDLGIENCDYVARGEGAEEVVDEMVTHLEEEHDMDMPEPAVILDTYPDDDTFIQELAEVFTGEPDEETRLVLQRLRDELNLQEGQAV